MPRLQPRPPSCRIQADGPWWRRDQSAAVAGRIAEIAPARAGYAVHAVAEARRPSFGRQLFHRWGPDFAGATLAMDHPDLPALPPAPKARLVSAGKLMAASAITAIPRLRYMRVSLVSSVVVGPQPQHAVTELICRTPASNDVTVITRTRHSRRLSSGRSHTCCRDVLTLHRPR